MRFPSLGLPASMARHLSAEVVLVISINWSTEIFFNCVFFMG